MLVLTSDLTARITFLKKGARGKRRKEGHCRLIYHRILYSQGRREARTVNGLFRTLVREHGINRGSEPWMETEKRRVETDRLAMVRSVMATRRALASTPKRKALSNPQTKHDITFTY